MIYDLSGCKIGRWLTDFFSLDDQQSGTNRITGL